MSAVIYAAIVVMWAVVLVPMWLRRHDAASESRSVDRFSTAMRTLSRRTSSGPGKRYVVMPRRGESAPTVHVSGAAAAARSPRRSAPVTAPIAPAAAKRVTARSPKSIVARRRRMLLGMAGVAFLTFVLAIAGVLSWPLQAVFDVVVIAFCIHLRAQARRATALSRTRSAAPAAPAVRPAPRMPAAPAAQPVAAPAAPAPAAASARAAAAIDDWDEDDEWGDDTWQPVPVPRPTYTMKPPAPAYEADPTYAPPVYDPAERTTATAAASAAEAAPDSDLDEILERRWAVND